MSIFWNIGLLLLGEFNFVTMIIIICVVKVVFFSSDFYCLCSEGNLSFPP